MRLNHSPRTLMRLLSREQGLALPMVIGMMMFFSISVTTVVIYTSSSERATDAHKKGSYANAAAEAALATAISVLGQSTDPTVSTLLPPCTVQPGNHGPGLALSPHPAKAEGYYCGALSGMDWTITATGVPKYTSTETVQVTNKTITQVASIVPFFAGGLGQLWNRVYQYDTSKCAEFKKIVVRVPVVTRGCVRLRGDNAHPSQLVGEYVSIGGNVDLKDQDSIGVGDTPISRADIAGTCKVEHQVAHTPCSSIDRVYASAISTTPDLARPTVDFPYWYANAKPGPMFGCTTGSLPGGFEFDKDTSYDRDARKFELTPADTDYSCQYWAGGELIGELAWSDTSNVLTVNGTIFFDGDILAKSPKKGKACKGVGNGVCEYITNYHGRGVIYASGKIDIEEGFCAGGDGSHDCQDDVSNWDPTQNVLIFISGGLKNVNEDSFVMNKDEAVFQGAVWSQGKCKIGKKASFSAPLICGQLGIKEDDSVDDPTINPWPASLIGSSTGQVWPSPAGDFQIMLQPQLGG